MFTMAQRLVVYPFWPLFDVGSTDLTPKARASMSNACLCVCTSTTKSMDGEATSRACFKLKHSNPYPSLRNPQTQQQLKRVLARVFRLFDADRDGALSDAELNALQVHCFKSTLQVRWVGACVFFCLFGGGGGGRSLCVGHRSLRRRTCMDSPTHPQTSTQKQEEDIKGVKKMVGKGCPGGVRREGITLEGFWEVVRLFLFNMQVLYA